jgi:hypothetical protein
MSNRKAKAATLISMMDLANRMESKLALLAALDRDVNAEDCMDVTDQVATLTHSLHRFTEAMMRANRVNGVDAEYEALFSIDID